MQNICKKQSVLISAALHTIQQLLMCHVNIQLKSSLHSDPLIHAQQDVVDRHFLPYKMYILWTLLDWFDTVRRR